jgi:hypothetical protein
MRTKSKLLFSLFAIMLSSFSAQKGFSQSVVLGVEFGLHLDGSMECIGKGACDCDVAGSIGTNVTFSISSANSSVLVLTFSLTDLKNSQPSQVAYFTSAAGSYPFEAAYPLSSSLFSALNLPNGATITPSCNSTVVIEGDVVTDYITLAGIN